MKIIIIGNTSMIAKRIHSRLEELGTVRMAGRGGEADIRFGLDEPYAFQRANWAGRRDRSLCRQL